MNRARSGSFDSTGRGRRASSSSHHNNNQFLTQHHPLRSRSLDRGKQGGRRRVQSGAVEDGYGSIIEARRSESLDEDDDVERVPLIIDDDDYDDDDDEKIPSSRTTTTSCKKDEGLLQDEIAGMANLTIPVIITSFLEMSPGIVTIILVGRATYDGSHHGVDMGGGLDGGGVGGEKAEEAASLKQLHLDAAALAVMILNVVALSPAFGMLTAMDTLCSQAYGADQSHKMGTYSLTGVSVISVIFLFSSIIMWNASSILIALGQPVAVSYFSGDFIRYLMIGVPFQCLYELIQKVSQSRNEARPMLISTLFCNIVNIGLGYYLVHCTAWGWLGAAVAHSVGEVIKVPSVLLCMVFGLGDSGNDGIENERGDYSDDTSDVSYKSNPQDMQSCRVPTAICDENVNEDDEDDEDDVEFLHHIWEGFVPKEALSPAAIIEFLRIGIPGMLQVMFEWVAFEVIALLCGILPGQEAIVGIGANSIIMNVSSITYTLYQGVAVSGNVRVGNALGAGEAHRAEVASKLTFACGAVLSCINVALLLTFRHAIPWIFTSDPDIIEQAKTLLLITTAFQFSDAFNACVQGVFRGSGRQALAAKYNFVAFYIIGIPLGYVLGVREGYGVEGLWLGITAGLFSIAIGETTVVMQSDWKKLASEANSRLSRVN